MIRPFGEAALLVETGDARHAHALAAAAVGVSGVTALVPGVETLLVEIDPLSADVDAVAAALEEQLARLPDGSGSPGRERVVPCLYGGEAGPDLDAVARLARLSADEVVARHTATAFTVDLLGFAPGFAYLAGLPAELAVPRLETPRTTTPAGSVAIAGQQSGIYPTELPGGWRVIGRTPITLFDPYRDPPTYLAAGDRVRFTVIARDAWEGWAGAPADW